MSWFSKGLKNLGLDSVLGFAGGVLSSNAKNKANSAANAQMIQWERERSQNAHQWEVEDLRKAGLNPILSAGGSGASTSGVSIIPAGESPFSSGINSALSTRSAIKSIEAIEQGNRKLEAEADIQDFLRQAYAEASSGSYGYANQDGGYTVVGNHNFLADKIKADAITSAKTAELVGKQIDALDADIAKKEAFAEMYNSDLGKYIAMAETLVPLVASAFNPLTYFGGTALKKSAQINSKNFYHHNNNSTNNYVNNVSNW